MANRDALDELRVIDKKTLRDLVPYSAAQIWRLEKAGKFPARIALGPNRVGYRLSDIRAWLNSRPAAVIPNRVPASSSSKGGR